MARAEELESAHCGVYLPFTTLEHFVRDEILDNLDDPNISLQYVTASAELGSLDYTSDDDEVKVRVKLNVYSIDDVYINFYLAFRDTPPPSWQGPDGYWLQDWSWPLAVPCDKMVTEDATSWIEPEFPQPPFPCPDPHERPTTVHDHFANECVQQDPDDPDIFYVQWQETDTVDVYDEDQHEWVERTRYTVFVQTWEREWVVVHENDFPGPFVRMQPEGSLDQGRMNLELLKVGYYYPFCAQRDAMDAFEPILGRELFNDPAIYPEPYTFRHLVSHSGGVKISDIHERVYFNIPGIGGPAASYGCPLEGGQMYAYPAWLFAESMDTQKHPAAARGLLATIRPGRGSHGRCVRSGQGRGRRGRYL